MIAYMFQTTTMMWRRCQPTLTYPPDFQ